MSRNVFVLIDGTLCSGDTGTNVVAIQEALNLAAPNKWFYADGIAAMSSFKLLQTIIPTEIHQEAFSIYKTLCAMEVNTEDKLVIIGYSRGAIIARILAQMITSDVARRDVIGSSERARQVLKRRTVDFLGLYDPVRGRPLPFTVRGYDADVHNNSAVLNLFEIVAIDEGFLLFASNATISSRAKVSPKYNVLKELARPSLTADDVVNADRSMTSPPKRHYCLLPGVHSDIGGQKADIALSSIATYSMIGEIVRSIPELKSSFDASKIQQIKDNMTSHPEIIIGRRSSFLRRIFKWRRNFQKNNDVTIHPIVDELIGRRGVNRSILLGRFRKYSIKKKLLDNARTTLIDL